jgi:outer membrane protein TolC
MPCAACLSPPEGNGHGHPPTGQHSRARTRGRAAAFWFELGHQEGIGREMLKIYQAGNKPRLDFRGGAGYRHMTIGTGAAGGLAYAAGVYLTFPFHDSGRTAGRVIQARSDLERMRLEKAKLADAIAVQVRQGANSVKESGEIVRSLGGNVVQAERLLAMAEKGYEYGVKTRLEVDDAQLNLRLAKSNLVKAKRDYLVACATLEWITGTIQTMPVK